jgi:signal transduction histidine kinase/DNA-binding response OmpR family regulator
MKKDQLVMYAKNHRASLVNLLGVVTFFVLVRYKLYGAPQGVEGYLIDIGVMLWSLLFLLRQRWLYGRMLAARDSLDKKTVNNMIFKICFNRLLYMVPWLCLLFSPFHSDYLYTHLLGYIFVFSVTATYASASAPLLGMMVFDIGLPVLFAMGVTVLNWGVQETPYIGGALLLFSVYVFFIGLKIRTSTLQLIDSKYQMQKSAKRADEANRAKSSFLALMSHEIRTPMTGIFGMIDFLKETDLTEEQKQFVVTIRECSKTLLNTLNDILDFSKVESGKLTISKVNFDLHVLLHNSATIMRQLADDKGLLLDMSIQKDVPQQVHGDPHRLQQTVLNLLNNAVKFTEKGSVALRAGMAMGGKNGTAPMLRIEVKDTGIGMSREGMDNLFNAFSQADSSISRRYGGTGLGLSITKSLVELMGGAIGCASEAGKGSTFWFEIPYEKPVDAPAEQAQETAEETTDVPPLHILVVEDNLINQQIVTRLLTHKKHKVTAVATAEDAIASVRETDFDMILMDVNMPGKSGIDATRSIRAMGGKYRQIPIVALTANIMEEYVKSCREAGMVDHIAKPFSPEDLYSGIARNLPRKDGAGKAAPQGRRPAAQAAKTMAQVLGSIRDELGPEYLLQMVDGNASEAKRLMVKVKAAHKDGNTEQLIAAVHDMKSVCGLIGMQKTSSAAAAIETEGIKGSKERLGGSILNLEALMNAESAQAAEMAKE